jgi:hypothetical protein
MDEINLLHALKDAAIEINDLHARVSALEKKIEKGPEFLDEVCNCPDCDGRCSYERVQDEQ